MRNRTRYILPAIVVVFSVSTTVAQKVMTLEEVIARAVSRNFDVLIETENVSLAALDNSASGAGMLPRINLGAGDTYSTNNILQRFASGQEITSPNAAGNQFNAFIQADWQIFDGMRMFYRRDRLDVMEEKAKVDLQNRIQQLTQQVSSQYANLIRLDKLIGFTRNIIHINEEKSMISRVRWESGSTSKSEFLQSNLALNEQKVNLLNHQLNFRAQRASLNELMGAEAEEEWNPLTHDGESVALDYEQVLNEVLNNNLQLKSMMLSQRSLELAKKEAAASALPSVNLFAAYNFTRVDNTAGFSLFNRSYGPQAGFSVILPLFNAGDIQRTKKKAEVTLKQSEWLVLQTKNRLGIRLSQLLRDLEEINSILTIESETNVSAAEWVNIELERLKNGQSNITEVYIAQMSLENSIQRLSEAEYRKAVIIAELKMLTAK